MRVCTPFCQVKLPSGETEGHANKGYSFVRYKDPRSCILAVENMDGYLPARHPLMPALRLHFK